MSRKLRIFISSTMKDMPRERRQIYARLKSFNFEPVMAEALPTSEAHPWKVIQEEIRSCDIVILILGEKYGWIPKEGPKSDTNLSVTQLEFEEAKSLGMPILPFLKKLSKSINNRSKDARKRNKFRDEIKDWSKGHFVAREFTSAQDLSNQVGEAVITLLSKRFWKERLAKRSLVVDQYAAHPGHFTTPQLYPSTIHLPSSLVEAVAAQKAILFAGSGFSLAAGLPSASAFTEQLIQTIREREPSYSLNSIGSALAGIATDMETMGGRNSLVRAVINLTGLPHIKPTFAHRKSVGIFNQIITTNYDTLFERVLLKLNGKSVIFDEIKAKQIPSKAIIKLHGSVNVPDSLLLTERDVLLMDKKRPNLWNAVLSLLKKKLVIAVGSSLRDPSIIRLFTEAGDQLSGFFVTPHMDKATPTRVRMWNLECITSDADNFFEALTRINR